MRVVLSTRCEPADTSVANSAIHRVRETTLISILPLNKIFSKVMSKLPQKVQAKTHHQP